MCPNCNSRIKFLCSIIYQRHHMEIIHGMHICGTNTLSVSICNKYTISKNAEQWRFLPWWHSQFSFELKRIENKEFFSLFRWCCNVEENKPFLRLQCIFFLARIPTQTPWGSICCTSSCIFWLWESWMIEYLSIIFHQKKLIHFCLLKWWLWWSVRAEGEGLGSACQACCYNCCVGL